MKKPIAVTIFLFAVMGISFAQTPVPDNFVRVEGGTFQMGSNSGDDDEEPVHTVTVKSFSIGKYEVTQLEWRTVMGNNPSRFKGENLPVENVSWYDAVEYCNKRSEKEGLTPAYTIDRSGKDPNNTNDDDDIKWLVRWNRNANGYRLPTEVEWEYAARGGNGSLGNYTYSGSNDAGSVAWYSGNNGSRGSANYGTKPVGTKAANGLGLYDMSGNVYEWCWDWYGSYASGAQTDPRGAASGSVRVLRGGSWVYDASLARSVGRNYSNPINRPYDVGFRLVRP
jgi:formylglycine-generating enzyme required for sulfatase activity